MHPRCDEEALAWLDVWGAFIARPGSIPAHLAPLPAFLPFHPAEFAAHGFVRPPSGSTLTGVVPSGTWKAQDGVYVVIGGNGNSVYSRLIAAMGRPDMGIDNPKFATDSKRCENEREILDVRGKGVCRFCVGWHAGAAVAAAAGPGTGALAAWQAHGRLAHG